MKSRCARLHLFHLLGDFQFSAMNTVVNIAPVEASVA